MDQTTN